MNVERQIEQQEHELKELLHAVMRDPLAPLLASVQQLQARVDELELQMQDAHQTALGALGMGTADIEKQIRHLKARVDATPDAVRETTQQLRSALEDGALAAISGAVMQVSAQLDGGMREVAAQGVRLQEDVTRLDGRLAQQTADGQEALGLVRGIGQSSEQATATLTQLSRGSAEQASQLAQAIARLQQEGLQREQAMQQAIGRVQQDVQQQEQATRQAIDRLLPDIQQQEQATQQAVVRVQQDLQQQERATQQAFDTLRTWLAQQDAALRSESAAGWRTLEQQASAQTSQLLQTVQSALDAQQQQLQAMREQQDAALAGLGQLHAASRWLRPAVTAAVVLAAAACAGVAALLLPRLA
jgi:hypothetical protein